MKKAAIIILILVLALGAVGFTFLTRPPAQPSENIQTASQSSELSTSTTPAAGEKLYRIAQDESQVQFKISEVLSGSPFSPVGTTNQISGDVKIKTTPDGTPNVTIGTITINARTFKTDSRQRDGAINHLILKTDDAANEFIVFKPTKITGLPTNITDGKSFSVKVTGNLTISGVTKQETFDIAATISGSKLTATPTTVLKRSDYHLVIPNIPFVADVTDNFTVSGTIVANLVQ